MNVRLGIIGGGQLAFYLCEAAQAIGLNTRVLAAECDAPAVHCADLVFIGPLDNLGVTWEMDIVSAHRTPDRLYQYAALAEVLRLTPGQCLPRQAGLTPIALRWMPSHCKAGDLA